jgi:hypothetical protein
MNSLNLPTTNTPADLRSFTVISNNRNFPPQNSAARILHAIYSILHFSGFDGCDNESLNVAVRNALKIVFLVNALTIAFALASRADSVTSEAESGALGADFAVSNNSTPVFITITSNSSSNNPGSAGRIATYTVTFPAAGTYQLYARLLVGPGSVNDDSLFYANGFGIKSPTTGASWVLVNNLANVGFTSDTDIVTGGGSAGTQVWKWINLSQFAPGPTFTVTAGNLTQTFQIGAREDGLAMDKFVFGTAGYNFTVSDLDSGAPGTPPATPTLALPPDVVMGNLIQFNDNGNWTWYCDERSVIDSVRGNLIVGSDASPAGIGGSARSGDVETVIYSVTNGSRQRFTLKDGASDPSAFYADDHNTPGLLVRPDGKYLAWYCAHNTERTNYWRNFDGTSWTPEQRFDWNTLPSGTDFNATYSNPHYLSAEDRTYNFVRENDHGSPNILISADQGETWTFAGQLTASLTNINVGYVSGYFKYSDNGVDRIDFIGTETHPRDSSTSMYHGYVKNGHSYKSDGTLIDANIFDQNAPVITQFTEIFTNGTVLPPGQTNYRCWNDDVQVYPDGTVQAIIATRINNDTQGNDSNISPNHAFFFCRFDGTNWSATYLCQAGTKLYSSEADYIGLGSLHPNDPNTVFISTKYDPRTVQLGVRDTNQLYSTFHEIWKGITTNHGATFSWIPITQNSLRDNLRPIVPSWDGNNTALLWFRCTYNTAQSIDGAPVGLIERHSEVPSLKAYVDADTSNTTLADGTLLVTGTGIGQWHLRSATSNGGSLLGSADVVAEDAPVIKTTVAVSSPGSYDVWVNFWGSPFPGADWRISAGLATNQMQTYRQMACKSVQAADYTSPIVVTNSATNFLYQAYVGRVSASSSNTISVFVDDNAVAVATTGTLMGNTNRTWYDGISYATVTSANLKLTKIVHDPSDHTTTITWSSMPADFSLSLPVYSVQKRQFVTDPNWTTIATGLFSAGTHTSFKEQANESSAFYRITSP